MKARRFELARGQESISTISSHLMCESLQISVGEGPEIHFHHFKPFPVSKRLEMSWRGVGDGVGEGLEMVGRF